MSLCDVMLVCKIAEKYLSSIIGLVCSGFVFFLALGNIMSKLKKFPSIPGNSNMDTGYRGLINQGATCYLNTVLQIFFMTPEFRDAVHEHSGPEKDKEKNLLFQLKKLFQNLEDGESEVKTTGVTRSLGMMHRDVWVQQDVAEFFRKILNEVSKESLVSENYQSTVINSIKCLTCGTEASDNSRYLDIPLPLNTTDHSASMMYSVKKGLLDFLKTELLEGDNQSYCDKCEMKTDTETRCYFQRLPQILTLQLKRFEFDYYQMSYVKIQCPVEIPLELQFQKAPTENTEWCFSATVPQLPLKMKMRSRQKLNKPKETIQALAVFPFQDSVRYELFAICDHSGGYRGGHYTARIKSFENGKWYTFNDSFVHEASYLMEPGFTQSVKEGKVPCISSSTAYLLMYRKSETSKPDDKNTVNGNQSDPRSTETNRNQRDPRSTESPKKGIPDEDQKWDAPAILGKKKDGTWCLSLDYKKIKPVTKKDSYLLHRINEALDYIVGSCWFSSLDLCSRDSEVQLSLEVRLKTVVSVDRERWQFQVKLFGLFMFECLVERVLVSVTRTGCFIYLDNLEVHTPRF
ncbi:ubiquitin carboxyl-terminal hydrolase 47-like isoform X7 [Acipenser oxyrinchus oxyrinchus]|uniref:Ubiquitin carboxyl-terminal hydrolase 47-like isoform X7 n=1 Tax=Acipenser oxyrinchus oxyrinchus TaxID=40147 RepID=A0AAD8D195_ACIOX|nr:ubiquitin carboxyl-terminal hydrolase 47-like isoform X7 [Acipenser oxyrinchus oxyrinchus]